MPTYYTENYADEYGRAVQLSASQARPRRSATLARVRWSATDAQVSR